MYYKRIMFETVELGLNTIKLKYSKGIFKSNMISEHFFLNYPFLIIFNLQLSMR